jgi:hypothetical protein
MRKDLGQRRSIRYGYFTAPSIHHDSYARFSDELVRTAGNALVHCGAMLSSRASGSGEGCNAEPA